MFLQSPTKYIDSQLNNLADKIEKDSPGLSVFAARQFCYQLYQTPVQIEITKERDLNILEEFILRASIEFNPPPTEVELAQILKLDPIFIQNTTNTLQSLQTLTLTPPDSTITITSEGKEFYTKGSLPQPPENKIIYAITNPLSEQINWRLSAAISKSPELPNLADFITFENTIPDITNLTIEEFKQQILDSDLGIHLPESGQIVTDFSVDKDAEKITWKAISILVIFDVIEEKLILQAREGNKILEQVSNQLQEMAEKGEVLLNELCGLPPESIASQTESILELKNQKVEERLQKIRQKANEIIKQTRDKGKKTLPKNSEFILLRDRQIRPEFLSTLKAATQQILIYSPWVTEEVVDEEFLQLLQKLANNGVWILIGYGIAEKQAEETKPMSPKVEEKLLTIRTPEDLPAAQIFWLGNSHAKEVLVDRKIHLSGSHNWLSYRGDRNFRGETTYKVTNTDTVKSAYEYLQARFQSHAENLWESAVSNQDINLAIKCVCIWGALGMTEIALQELQYHNWIELFPVWLKIVIQGLRSKQISPDEPIFEKATSWLNIVDKSDKNIEHLQSGWQRVIEAIARQNRQAALSLLNEAAWAEFIRLKISSTDTPEKFILNL
ncbi:hypothetical protein AFK68_18455 [Hydrocoleum sp. CS-953]|uniref:hypothetical protein n=1 Tax=Hydrocoleum sp. CS-953 TaxID=1671698 RepID=UPI000B9C4EC8|nr:hypothetical protein [Hydrocoleum sp. CS-953]OZH53311.1 hypothetical protein AFK68_18455 [Hydrocoleum sp. CS-953]